MASLLSAASDALAAITQPCGISEIKGDKPDMKVPYNLYNMRRLPRFRTRQPAPSTQ